MGSGVNVSTIRNVGCVANGSKRLMKGEKMPENKKKKNMNGKKKQAR